MRSNLELRLNSSFFKTGLRHETSLKYIDLYFLEADPIVYIAQLPKCRDKEELATAYSPPEGAYTILPNNGSLFLTLTDDSLVYADFCVDRGFKPNSFGLSAQVSIL
jgi:hypothetical protein